MHLFVFVVPEVYMWPLGEKSNIYILEDENNLTQVTTRHILQGGNGLTFRMVAISNQFHSKFCLWLRM